MKQGQKQRDKRREIKQMLDALNIKQVVTRMKTFSYQ